MPAKLKQVLKEYGTQVLIVIAGISLIIAINNRASDGPSELENQAAPEFTLASLSGEEVSLASHLGKGVIVLDFFATWCPPCVEGLPVVDKLAAEYAGKGVVVYAVNVYEKRQDVESFIEGRGLKLGVLLDETGEVSDRYLVQGIPQTVIIGMDGKVAEVHVGVGSGFEEELRASIEAALNPSPAAENAPS